MGVRFQRNVQELEIRSCLLQIKFVYRLYRPFSVWHEKTDLKHAEHFYRIDIRTQKQ